MRIQATRERFWLLFGKAKPFLGVVLLQAGVAGMDIISKVAMNRGMSTYVLVVYRHAIATIFISPFAFAFDKKIRPRMTVSIFWKILLLSLLEPIIDQNFYFLGMKHTTATFTAAMANVLPAITFLMACFFRLEKVKLKSTHSQAKIVGTLATVAGAMIMTLVRGTNIPLPWTKEGTKHGNHQVKEDYQGAVVALIMEKGNAAAWSLKWDIKFFAAAYSGIFCSGIAYYVQGVVMKERGPVFVTAFSPLSMILVAILSSFILAEKLYLGRVIGAVVIIVGLYFVVWGKRKDYKPPSAGEQEPPVNQSGNNDDQSNARSDLEIVAANASGWGAVNGRV
ncbi:WAT1-related protein [Sesamum angolense]|uniref:WAT1-related protein n=1 Tax=Sesamum angolense TaxID=2727404 RepID=A0AAE1WFB8_9LAMI|nr:WAT1-related protein [Sesamum angolense]